MTAAVPEPDGPADGVHVEAVEKVVRDHLAKALGGTRGMLEAAVPTIAFTLVFLIARDIRWALIISVGCAAVLLVARAVARSSPQFVLNSLVGIGIGALFAWRSARGGGSADDQALAYFLPGLLYNVGYSVVLLFTVVIKWPLVGFVVGSVTGDPTAWHEESAMVRLCGWLTALLALPCVIRVVVQGPMYLAGRNGWWAPDTAVAALGTSKLVMGWPLQVAAFAAMAWLLARRNSTVGVVETSEDADAAL